MKKLQTRVIPVLIFSTVLAAHWLAFIPVSTLNVFANTMRLYSGSERASLETNMQMEASSLTATPTAIKSITGTNRPPGLPHSQIVDPPTFSQDQKSGGCDKSRTDFDMTPKTNPNFYDSLAHYRVLTINKGGPQCDHLLWPIKKTVPQAATTSCLFFMHFPGIDSKNSFRDSKLIDHPRMSTDQPVQVGQLKLGFKLLGNTNNMIKESKEPTFQGDLYVQAKGVSVVYLNFSQISAGTPIDVGILFVDCDSVNDLHL